MSHEKDMEECSLSAHNSVKEASVKRLYAVWFQIYDILKRQNYGDKKKVIGCQGLGEGWITGL